MMRLKRSTFFAPILLRGIRRGRPSDAERVVPGSRGMGDVDRAMLGADEPQGNFLTESIRTIMDITECRQGEVELHRAHAELAHVTRLATMGALAASLAHELSQPLAAVMMNAAACLRWLERDHERDRSDGGGGRSTAGNS